MYESTEKKATFRDLLLLKIKMDILKELQENPDLDDAEVKQAFKELASPETLDTLVQEMLVEERQEHAVAAKPTPQTNNAPNDGQRRALQGMIEEVTANERLIG